MHRLDAGQSREADPVLLVLQIRVAQSLGARGWGRPARRWRTLWRWLRAAQAGPGPRDEATQLMPSDGPHAGCGGERPFWKLERPWTWPLSWQTGLALLNPTPSRPDCASHTRADEPLLGREMAGDTGQRLQLSRRQARPRHRPHPCRSPSSPRPRSSGAGVRPSASAEPGPNGTSRAGQTSPRMSPDAGSLLSEVAALSSVAGVDWRPLRP